MTFSTTAPPASDTEFTEYTIAGVVIEGDDVTFSLAGGYGIGATRQPNMSPPAVGDILRVYGRPGLGSEARGVCWRKPFSGKLHVFHYRPPDDEEARRARLRAEREAHAPKRDHVRRVCSNCLFAVPAKVQRPSGEGERGVPVMECRRNPPPPAQNQFEVGLRRLVVEKSYWCGEFAPASESRAGRERHEAPSAEEIAAGRSATEGGGR